MGVDVCSRSVEIYDVNYPLLCHACHYYLVGVANCPLCGGGGGGGFTIAQAQTGPTKCPLYGIVGCPLFRDF